MGDLHGSTIINHPQSVVDCCVALRRWIIGTVDCSEPDIKQF